MARKPSVFIRELTANEKQKLTSIKRKRNIDYSLRQRADIILLSNEGCEIKLIAHRVGFVNAGLFLTESPVKN